MAFRAWLICWRLMRKRSFLAVYTQPEQAAGKAQLRQAAWSGLTNSFKWIDRSSDLMGDFDSGNSSGHDRRDGWGHFGSDHIDHIGQF